MSNPVSQSTNPMRRLAERSGIDFDQIKARVAREAACHRHLYQIGAGPFPLGAQYECQHCGAKKRLFEMADYIRGYQAAGGDARDICPDWSVRR